MSPKEFLLRLVAGPIVFLLLGLLGIPSGYYLGFVASCVLLPIVALVLAIAWAKQTDEGVTALFIAVFAALTGVLSASGYANLRALETGSFVRDVALADLPAWRGKDKLTLRDGAPQYGLLRIASTRFRGSTKTWDHIVVSCEAFPITPADWTSSSPVRAWVYGERLPSDLHNQVFHPGEPSTLCREAIDKSSATFHLTTADDVVWLEATADNATLQRNRLAGAFAGALTASLWIVVVLFQGIAELLRWARRKSSS